MKTRYYYKEELVRTSNNLYTHAVVSSNKDGSLCVWCCCGRYQLAVKRYNSEIAHAFKIKIKAIESIKEIDNGTYLDYGYNEKGKWCRCRKLNNEELIKEKEMYIKEIERCKRIANTLKVVELEVK